MEVLANETFFDSEALPELGGGDVYRSYPLTILVLRKGINIEGGYFNEF